MTFSDFLRHRQSKSLTATLTSSLTLSTILCLLQGFTETAQATGPTLTPLANFSSYPGPSLGKLLMDVNGDLFGNTYNSIFKYSSTIHKIQYISYFTTQTGQTPYCGLISDASGNLYGTASNGGANGMGTVFKWSAATHTLSPLVTFNGTNGSFPTAALVADNSGNLYGTTCLGNGNLGTLFKLDTTTNKLTTLVTFDTNTGGSPFLAQLLLDSHGNLYGTTDRTIFKLDTTTNALTTLISFPSQDGTSSGYPLPNSLVADTAGNLYGTTYKGGANGLGMVFEVTAGSHELITLADFNGTNGSHSLSGLLIDAAGNLFGNTYQGGTNNLGTIFEIDSATHTLTTLINLNSFTGNSPYNNDLIADATGNLYGVMPQGGGIAGANSGTIFMLTNSGFVVAPEPATLALFAPALLLFLKRRKP